MSNNNISMKTQIEHNRDLNEQKKLSSIASERIILQQDFAQHPIISTKLIPNRYSVSKKSLISSELFPEPSQTIINQQQQLIPPMKHIGLHLNFSEDIDTQQKELINVQRSHKQKYISYEAVKSFQQNNGKTGKKNINLNAHIKKDQQKCMKSSWYNPDYNQQKQHEHVDTKQQLQIHKQGYQSIINYYLQPVQYEHSLQINFTINRNQHIQISKKPQTQDKMILENNLIKYRIQRFVTKIKFSVILYRNSQDKLWKDIQLPLLSHEIDNQYTLQIKERINGKIDVKFDDFDFSFMLTPLQNRFRYCLKNLIFVRSIKLEQCQKIQEKINTGCSNKCSIF